MNENEKMYCAECFCAYPVGEKSSLPKSYVCRFNPLKPVEMGLEDGCDEREQNLVKQYAALTTCEEA